MDDSLLVGLVERARDLREVEHHFAGGQRAAPLELAAQVVTLEPLHHHEGHLAEVLADVGIDNPHDVLALDAHRRSGFGAEALHGGLVLGEGGMQQLEGELLLGVGMADEVDGPHAAAAEHALDAVAAVDRRARFERDHVSAARLLVIADVAGVGLGIGEALAGVAELMPARRRASRPLARRRGRSRPPEGCCGAGRIPAPRAVPIPAPKGGCAARRGVSCGRRCPARRRSAATARARTFVARRSRVPRTWGAGERSPRRLRTPPSGWRPRPIRRARGRCGGCRPERRGAW